LVDRASLYNLVNKANLVHIVHQVGFVYKITRILSCGTVVANERYDSGVSRWLVGLGQI